MCSSDLALSGAPQIVHKAGFRGPRSSVLEIRRRDQLARGNTMRSYRWAAAAFALALATMSLTGQSRAEPILRGGIGLQSCEKLAADIKPADGFNHLPNALLFYWVQGYLSAANIYLLGEYTKYVDIGTVTAEMILPLVADFCKANPDKRPVNAIDDFIKKSKKIEAKESDAFDPREH